MAPHAFPWPTETARTVIAVLSRAVAYGPVMVESDEMADVLAAIGDLMLTYNVVRPLVGEQARECELPVIDRRRLHDQREECARAASSEGSSTPFDGAARGSSSADSPVARDGDVARGEADPPSRGSYVGDRIFRRRPGIPTEPPPVDDTYEGAPV